MHGSPAKFFLLILAILLLVDIYSFRGLRHFSNDWNNSFRIAFTIFFWLIPVFITFMTFFILYKLPSLASGMVFYRTLYTFMGILILFYVPKILFSAFLLGNDLVAAVAFGLKKYNFIGESFNNQWFRYVGAMVALLLFFFTFYGIIFGRYHYKVNHLQLKFSNLPEQFNGFKIVQISDWHIGSYFGRQERIKEAVRRVNSLNPDLIVFTGDMVNNMSNEVDEFIPELKQLKAKYGIYSILGNHDYGEYVNWKSEEESRNNLQRLREIEKEIGFQLLDNQSVTIEKDGAKFALIGIENWGLPPFPQYGNLKKAMEFVDDSLFKILLSHDPSHWEAEVMGKSNIDLTLSGHTHGMQFGINYKNMKWSPVKYKYPRWAGLYKEGLQLLYVNVGIGYIGFPGRVGMRPEIALLELIVKK
jgi:uncharacterized protein